MSQIEIELQEWMGSDESIANAAWTSTYDKTKREGKYDDPEKVAGIVRRCVTEGHSVPLESVVLRFWCRWPVFVDRQHMTHRMASHNGLSARYRTLPEDFSEIPNDVCDIFDKVRPGAGSTLWGDHRNVMEQQHQWYREHLKTLKHAEAWGMITNAEFKRAREVLRGVLGTAFMVERTTIMNLVSFANYQRLRNSEHAQPEIREGAQKMLNAVIKANVAPTAINALVSAGWTLAQPNHESLLWMDR